MEAHLKTQGHIHTLFEIICMSVIFLATTTAQFSSPLAPFSHCPNGWIATAAARVKVENLLFFVKLVG